MTRENAKAFTFVTNNKTPLSYVATWLRKYRLWQYKRIWIFKCCRIHYAKRWWSCNIRQRRRWSWCDYYLYFPATPGMFFLSIRGFMSTTEQRWTVALLTFLLDNIYAPDYAIRMITEWACSAKDDGQNFHKVVSKGRQMLKLTFKTLPNASSLLRPSSQPKRRLDGSSRNVIVLDFFLQLLQLLQNPSVITPENLAIDFHSPFCAMKQSQENVLFDALSVIVYWTAYERFITCASCQLFVPIIQWINRTSVTWNERFSLKPCIFTPAILSESFCWTFKALENHEKSSAQNQRNKQGVNTHNYPAELCVVLEIFRSANNQLFHSDRGDIAVDIVTCLLFVMQDMQEGEMLSCQNDPHTPSMKWHWHSCDVSYEELDNPEVKCSYLLSCNMDLIAQSDRKEL